MYLRADVGLQAYGEPERLQLSHIPGGTLFLVYGHRIFDGCAFGEGRIGELVAGVVLCPDGLAVVRVEIQEQSARFQYAAPFPVSLCGIGQP